MVVKLVLALREGWKAEENRRFGLVFEMRFVDSVTNKVMFRYAACLEDRPVWIDYFEKLRIYDEHLIKQRGIISLIDKSALPENCEPKPLSPQG